MTQETTLTIPRFVELVGVWMGKNGFDQIDFSSYQKFDGWLGGYVGRIGVYPHMVLTVEWGADKVCQKIRLTMPEWCADAAVDCAPTESGLMAALTEFAERLRGVK